MKQLLMIGAVLTALVTLGATAEAGHGHGWNSGHWNSGPRYGGGGFYGQQVYPFRRAPIVHRSWHDTSHLHYHPGGLQLHGNHFHYVPGHYDLHRTGHWDTHLHH